MMTHAARAGALTGAALLVAFSIGQTAAIAQEAEPAIEQVIVVAPRVLPEEQRRLGTSKITTSSTLQATVSYADLDLTRTADVGELEKRIADAAKSVCEALAKEVPFGEPRTSTCVNEALDDAQKQVKLLVDKAVGS